MSHHKEGNIRRKTFALQIRRNYQSIQYIIKAPEYTAAVTGSAARDENLDATLMVNDDALRQRTAFRQFTILFFIGRSYGRISSDQTNDRLLAVPSGTRLKEAVGSVMKQTV